MKYQSPNQKNFKKFGKIIDVPKFMRKDKKKNLFSIVTSEKEYGWRIAYLVLRDRFADKLEQHPQSLESFEPVKGKTILFVAPKDDPNKVTAFRLDKPVVLYKGIWHGVITLGKESEIKITENLNVSINYHEQHTILKTSS